MSQVTISGAISGLDTAGIIEQLVGVQRNQQTLLKTQQSSVQKRADAYTALAKSLTSLGTQAAGLADTSSWVGAKATSSSSTVTATASGTGTGALTFDVTKVAAAHTLVSDPLAIGSPSEVIASGPLTITAHDGTETTVDVGSGSLADVVDAINSSDAGLVATAIRTKPGEYRLQVASKTSGAESDFTLDGLNGPTGMSVLTQASDAEITVGDPLATFYTVTSSTNTFADLVPGMSFAVSRLETGVTVTSVLDGSSVADKVSALVDAANGILSDIAAKTTFNTTTKTGGPFTGQSAVRVLQQNILTVVSQSGAPGVGVTREGRLDFDREAFLAAFAAGPSDVAKAFGSASSFEAAPGAAGTTVTLTAAGSATRAGTYDIQVTTLPTKESWRLDPPGGSVIGHKFTLIRDTTTVSYTGLPVDTLSTAADALNSLFDGADLGITATFDGSGLVFTADSTGAASAFTASLNDVLGTKVATGSEIEGFIDGQPASGSGTVLSLQSGEGGAVGLAVDVSTTPADLAATGGAIGAFTHTPGLARQLSLLVKDATATTVGTLSTAQASASSEIKRFQTAIDAWDERLTTYRQTLTRQFTAMETVLARLKSTTSALSGLIKTTTSDSES